jgi:hypothetical protein
MESHSPKMERHIVLEVSHLSESERCPSLVTALTRIEAGLGARRAKPDGALT